jgi:hypothetical protein
MTIFECIYIYNYLFSSSYWYLWYANSGKKLWHPCYLCSTTVSTGIWIDFATSSSSRGKSSRYRIAVTPKRCRNLKYSQTSVLIFFGVARTGSSCQIIDLKTYNGYGSLMILCVAIKGDTYILTSCSRISKISHVKEELEHQWILYIIYIYVYIYICIYTIWLFNIAMENHHFL